MNSRIISIIAMIFMAIPSWAYPFPVQNEEHSYIWADAYGDTIKEAKYSAMQELSFKLGVLVESEITTINNNGNVSLTKSVTSKTYNAFCDISTYVIYNDDLKYYQGYAYLDVDEHIKMVKHRYNEYISVSEECFPVVLGHNYMAFCVIARDVLFRTLCPEADSLMEYAYNQIDAVRSIRSKTSIWFGDKLENGDIVMFNDIPKPWFHEDYQTIKEYYRTGKNETAKIRYSDGSYQ